MITQFIAKYAFLSNFHPCPVHYEGILYPTTEHAFQAAKSSDPEERQRIANLATPGQAKRAGRAVKIQDIAKWNETRLQVMEHICRLKFNNSEMAQKLLETGDEEIVEGNTWNDTYWGVCRGKGHNNLGKILMKIRQDLESAKIWT